MGRSRDEVQEFVLDKIQGWLSDIVIDDPNGKGQDELSMLYSDIRNNEMLYKEQAKMLEDLLHKDMIEEIDKKTIYGRRIEHITMLDIDAWSIYADAWGIYCRPGTYMIVL